jgi:hypothetical protein
VRLPRMRCLPCARASPRTMLEGALGQRAGHGLKKDRADLRVELFPEESLCEHVRSCAHTPALALFQQGRRTPWVRPWGVYEGAVRHPACGGEGPAVRALLLLNAPPAPPAAPTTAEEKASNPMRDIRVSKPDKKGPVTAPTFCGAAAPLSNTVPKLLIFAKELKTSHSRSSGSVLGPYLVLPSWN